MGGVDNHAKVEGPIVMDVMENFTNRWIRQNPKMMDAVLDVEEDDSIVLDASAPENSSGGPFVVQLLRSITVDSALMDEDRGFRVLYGVGLLVAGRH